ncbi:serine/threonine protein kinase [bacterium]|nr:serine/threonine protein kinase [bacterium]
MGGEVLKKFGRYFLLDQIAQGGMAEIYRARLAAADAAGRLLVIKRMQSGYGSNREFHSMFKSEIKVTMGFNHPNIVQVYDFGDEESQPYIAMEWVDGRNLRQFLSRFGELKQSFPVDLAVYIIEQASSGLHYAHCFKDKITGEPLHVVHRDISPQNVLISYEGNVKVIDFGIAKATTNSESTRAGVIKGKPSYLSPEQISGEVLDGRSDIFALGIVLWELLTGKKLFAGENDLAVLKLIESCTTHVKPPSTVNANVPKELDYIVLKALAKQREKRYQTADELQRALHKFLYSFSPEFNPNDLAYYAKDLFKKEIVEDRKRVQRLNDKVEQLLLIDAPVENREAVPPQKKDKDDDTTAVVHFRKADGNSNRILDSAGIKNIRVEIDRAKSPLVDPGSPFQPPRRIQADVMNSPTRMTEVRAPKQKQKLGGGGLLTQKNIAIAGIALVLVAWLGADFGIRIPFLSDLDIIDGGSAQLFLKGEAKDVRVSVNGEVVANEIPTVIRGMSVGTPFQVTVVGPTGVFQEEVTLKKGERKELTVAFNDRSLSSVPATSASGATSSTVPDNRKEVLVKVNVMPPSNLPIRIVLNGRMLDLKNPQIKVKTDSPLEVSVNRPGFKPYQSEFVVQAAAVHSDGSFSLDVRLEPSKFGRLTLKTTPTSEKILLTDQTTGYQLKYDSTPLTEERIPPGTYSISLSNDVLGMGKTIKNVKIDEGKFISIEEKLDIRD